METAPMTTPAPIVETPTPTPAPAPMVAQPMVQAQPPMMENGGNVGGDGSIKSFFKSLNYIEVGLTILGVTALIYTIHYYRFKSKEDKMVNNELQRQIDEIKMNLQSKMNGKYKTI
jgi:hypothetical protein